MKNGFLTARVKASPDPYLNRDDAALALPPFYKIRQNNRLTAAGRLPAAAGALLASGPACQGLARIAPGALSVWIPPCRVAPARQRHAKNATPGSVLRKRASKNIFMSKTSS